jgi:NAD(P)-dependent dehydrogenase (short-subunit alcohol dehydrogenase family)
MTASTESPVALVTGGGNGIGAAVCAKLAASGHRPASTSPSRPPRSSPTAPRHGSGRSWPPAGRPHVHQGPKENMP